MKIRPKGVSLLVTILFVTAFLFVVTGLAQSTIFALRDIRDFVQFDQSLNLSRGISDLLQLYIEQQTDSGIGLDIPSMEGTCLNGVAIPADTFGFGQRLCDLTASLDLQNLEYSFELRARPPATLEETLTFSGSSDWRSIPIQRTGTASSNCTSTDNDSNDSCHWNVISPGEVVEIPLFYNDATGTVTTLGDAPLRLRIRAPLCAGISACPSSGRFTLYPTDPASTNHWKNDPTIFNWQISADNDTFKSNQDLDAATGIRDTTTNSEIYATRINNASGYVLLNESASGETLDGTDMTIGAFLATAQRPYLQLQLTTIPKDDGWLSSYQTALPDNLSERVAALSHLVPYLEYQLLTSNSNLADEKRIARASVTIGDFTQTYEKTVYLEPGAATTSLEDL